MRDIARLETDSPEVRDKYRTLPKEMGDFKWAVVGDGTLFRVESLV